MSESYATGIAVTLVWLEEVRGRVHVCLAREYAAIVEGNTIFYRNREVVERAFSPETPML
jgi:hypothetical protein